MDRRFRFAAAFVGIVGLFLFLVSENDRLPEPLKGVFDGAPNVQATTSILFTGDVMLSRGVEWRMLEQGFSYPFIEMRDVFEAHEFVVVNLEGTMPARHVPAPAMTFQFSIRSELAQTLQEVGVTHASLANNHAYDYGRTEHLHTRNLLSDAKVESFGHPYSMGTSSVSLLQLDERTIAFVAADLVLSEPSAPELAAAFAYAQAESDFIVVLVHWGTEYSLTHSTYQRRWAEAFVDLGADLIIGHHPHVVQDIEKIGQTIVFYSLGNFIFDQYFSEDVQRGLAVSLSLDDSPTLHLLPVSSKDSRNQPTLMLETEREKFLESIAERSDAALKSAILQGIIEL